MTVRIGVDVGGTFTKAVACEAATGEVVARAIVPTTHQAAGGVAEGAIRALSEVASDVAARELGPIQLVAHSTTQAVNALLEGDTSTVGVLGIGRRPDLKRARRRTAVGEVRLAPGRKLATRHVFLDGTDGLDRPRIVHAIQELVDEGAEVLCISEAFGVEDARGEWLALDVAEDLGVPACAGHELTGLYGLEMRTVTGALNASILPTALRTARMVEEAVARDLPGVPVLVMRGDGGAVGIDTMKRHPLLTAFSGPAASVAGALRHVAVHEGVVVEVGGTSTNISTIRGGRPVLSYIRVLDHVTCVRSVDVRVVGVAGGSLLRIARRLGGRARLADVGPRSAHIAGLSYACFSSVGELEGATPALIAPRPGDPAEYLVLKTASGRRIALTLTCAANALGEISAGAYATGDATAALAAFEIAARWLGTDAHTLARATVDAAAGKVARAVGEAASEQGLANPQIVGLGGGAGALIPALGRAMGWLWTIPREAEVISSVGDALSLVRIEVERTLPRATAEAVADVHREAEEAAIGAGAAPHSIQVESEAVPERGALRVTAYGSAALESSDHTVTENARPEESARLALGASARHAASNGYYSVFVDGTAGTRAFAVVDRQGAIVVEGRGTILTGTGAEVAAAVEQSVPALVRHFGPVTVAPALRIVRGARVIDLTLISSPEAALQAALAECALAHDETVVALLSRD